VRGLAGDRDRRKKGGGNFTGLEGRADDRVSLFSPDGGAGRRPAGAAAQLRKRGQGTSDTQTERDSLSSDGGRHATKV